MTNTDDMRRVLHWRVPVDDEWHLVKYNGPIVHVPARMPELVDFWTLSTVDAKLAPVPQESLIQREFRVFGTGMVVDGVHEGTAICERFPPGRLVWHLFSRYPLWIGKDDQ